MRGLSAENNLKSKFPKVAKEWHPTKNGELKSYHVTPFSSKKAWFICKKGHEYQTTIVSRTNMKSGCPYCYGNKVGYGNDFQSQFPQIAKEFHPTLNGDLKPSEFYKGSKVKVWWQCGAGHEWKTSFGKRSGATKTGCPNCSKQTSKPELYFYTELKSIFKEVYHRKKLNRMEVDIFISDINLAVEYDGVRFHKNKVSKDKIKKAKIKNMNINLINVREKPLKKIFNDDVLIDYRKSYSENFRLFLKNLITHDFVQKNQKKIITKYLSDNEQKNEKLFIKLLSYLSTALPGNSLKDKFPEIAKEWHPTKNKALTPEKVNYGVETKVWFICKEGHEYETSVSSRTNMKSGCPYCANKKVGYGNDLRTKNPSLAKEWHPTKNGELKPSHIIASSHVKLWWKCKNGHEWEASLSNRFRLGRKCPYCAHQKVGYGNDLQSRNPELSKEWHPTKNEELTPSDVYSGSNKKVWWKCNNGHEWEASIANRSKKGRGCYSCYKINRKLSKLSS